MSDELPKLEPVRGREPAPAKPDGFDQALLLIGGRSPRGEPSLKVSWGWDLKRFRNGDPEALKYPGPFLNRWILEKWLPAEFFGSNKQWEANRYAYVNGKRVDLLGDYPREGEYGMVMPLVSPDGGFLPLGDAVLQFISMVQKDIETRTHSAYSDAKHFARLQTQMAAEEAREDEERDKKAQAYADYFRPREFELNKERAYSLPTIWTPDGEHTVH